MVAEAMRQTNFSEMLGFVSKLERKADSRRSRLGLAWEVLKLVYYQTQLNAMSESALKEINASLKTCDLACPKHSECMNVLIKKASYMVERLDVLVSKYRQVPKFAGVSKIVEKHADRWQALLEELYIRTSPERYKEYLVLAQDASSQEEADNYRAAFAAEEAVARHGSISHEEMKRRLTQ